MPEIENPYYRMMALGACRSIFGYPFDTCLGAIKFAAQANPDNSSFSIIQQIARKKGLPGFFNLGLVSFNKRFLKECVRWPVITKIHFELNNRFPQTFSSDGLAKKLVTAVCVAAFDVGIIVPVDQLLAYRAKEEQPYRRFFKTRYSQIGIRSLYRGAGLHLLNQAMAWSILLGGDSEAKKLYDHYFQKESNPFFRQAMSSCVVGVGLTLTALPVDFVKTRIQMDTNLHNQKYWTAAKLLKQQFGFRCFYSGALPVYCHSFLYATVVGWATERYLVKKQ